MPIGTFLELVKHQLRNLFSNHGHQHHITTYYVVMPDEAFIDYIISPHYKMKGLDMLFHVFKVI